MSKYGNKRVMVDGVWFDSQREAKRYGQLKMMEKAGEISALTLQVYFTLAESVVLNGRKKPALRYVADFCYNTNDGFPVVEDCKGHKTAVYRIKQHLMKSIFGIDIKET